MTLVDDIVSAFQALGGIAHYSDLYKYLENQADGDLPKNWKAIVRARIEERSSDSSAFKYDKDLFYAVEGLGNGVWGLRSFISPTPVASDIEEPQPTQKIKIETNRIIRDTKITKQLKLLYRNTCQICGKIIMIPNQNYSEAHHIQPLGNPHNGPDISSNILILCPNHHAEFDYGSIAINPDTRIIIHIDLQDEFHGRPISIKSKHNIDPKYLRYHLEKIFKKG